MMVSALNRVMQRLRAGARRHDCAEWTDSELLEWFIADHDEDAFEALVRRHGAMVLGVCRRILRNDADAEDAFQATFLVLVRKASSIRPRGMVSNWLYGVAHNTALKAKSMNHKRRIKEIEAGTMPKHEAAQDAWSQVQSVVDAELSRLPDKYRVPIILCDLEGKTIKEAMHHLGWPQGTVASRLTRGRALLAKRLTKHGVTLSAGMLAGALLEGAASASVPAALTASTVQAAALFAVGKAAVTGVSATALALTDGMLKTMLLCKLKVAVGAMIVIAALTTGVGGVAYYLTNQDVGEPTYSAKPSIIPVSDVKPDLVALPAEAEAEEAEDEPEIAGPPPRVAPPPPPDEGVKVVRVIIVRSSDARIGFSAPAGHNGRTATTVQVQITSPGAHTPGRIEIQRAIVDAVGKGNTYVIDLSGVQAQKVIIPALNGTPGGAVFNVMPTNQIWVIMNKGHYQVIQGRTGSTVSSPMAPTTYYSFGPLAP